MKLHLPKLLSVALLSTSFSYAVTTTEFVDETDMSTYKHVDVGFGESGKTKADDSVVTIDSLTVNSKDKVGVFDGQNLVENFTYNKDGSKYSNVLKVNSSLTINGSGKVSLGGQYGQNYSGIIANEVLISSDATGTAGSPNLYADRAEIGTLTLNGGSAVFHDKIYNGNSYPGGDNSSKKQTCISNISISGDAYLSLGSANNNADNEGHYNTVLGSSSTDCKVEQKSGTMTVNGYTIAMNGLTLDQNGGTMTFNDRIAVATSYGLNLGGSVALNIKQGGESKDTELSFGDIGTVNYKTMVVFTPWKASSVSVNVDQTGNGTINIGDTMKTATYSICQGVEKNGVIEGVEGVINQNGDIKASDIYITGTLVNNGTINKTDGNSLLEIVGGKVENNGSIYMNISMTGGELTAADGSTFADITATSGTIYLGDNLTLGTLTLGGDAIATATFDLRSQQNGVTVYVGEGGALVDDLKIKGDNVTFVAKTDGTLADITEPLTLFRSTTDGTDYDLSKAKLVIEDSTGEKTEVAFTDNHDGTVTVTGSIPEPTTATLSLLALAALASRRRRK